MSMIYIVDYGIGKSKNKNEAVNKFFIDNGWSFTGFNTTFWKEVVDGCDVTCIKEILKTYILKHINQNNEQCDISLLVICTDKNNVIGTKNEVTIFSFNPLIQPLDNNHA